jgi:hypothetical protein
MEDEGWRNLMPWPSWFFPKGNTLCRLLYIRYRNKENKDMGFYVPGRDEG